MSGETLTPIELIEHAEDVVNELCQGKRKWRMSVPARPDDDPDLVIGRGLQAGRDALAEVRRLREALEKWQEREAAVCPEDVGFEEYIAYLQGKILGAVTELRATEAPAYPEPCSYCGEPITALDRHDDCGSELSLHPVTAAR